MYYAGIDYLKRYSVVSIQDAEGQIVQEERVDHAYPDGFRRLFRECGEPVSVVYESTFNWSWLYKILQCLKNVLEALDEEIGEDEQLIRQTGKADHATKILSSIPGGA